MSEQVLVLSVKPRFAKELLRGVKTVELRRVRPRRIRCGDYVLLYATAPKAVFAGFCRVAEIVFDSPVGLWPRVQDAAGITRREYFEYFRGADHAIGIVVERPIAFVEGLSLNDSRRCVPGFMPPQSFCYLDGFGDDLGSLLRDAMRRARKEDATVVGYAADAEGGGGG